MGEKDSAMAAGLKALGNISVSKLDYPKHCKYRSGQLVDNGKRVWEPDEHDPSRAFKVWHCRRFDTSVLWRDCRDKDNECSCAEVDDGEG